MKIPSQLYQFKQEPALIVVSGAYDARLFVAKDGAIIQKRFAKTDEKKKDRDTDSQSSFEHRNELLHEQFLHNLRDESFSLFLKERITDVYLFAPHYVMLAILRQALHPFLRQRVSMKIEGDFRHHHPTEVIKMITARKSDLKQQPGQIWQLLENVELNENPTERLKEQLQVSHNAQQ